MFYKSIFQGRLDFANLRTYEKIQALFVHRLENYYKNETHFKSEDIFDPETLRIIVPRTVVQLSEKYWKNTVSLFVLCADYAVAGYVGSWMMDEGKIKRYTMAQPKGDKSVVQQYIKAVKLINQEGKEAEAIERLNKAIDKFDQHSQAYERRGHINLMLKSYDDAEYDFNKSIRLDENNAFAYFGRGKLHAIREEFSLAAEDYQMSIRKSLALQSIHWQARRMKAAVHSQLKEFDKAIFEYKLFTNRKFPVKDVNNHYRDATKIEYAKALIETENYDLALEILEQCGSLEDQKKYKENEKYFLIGKAKALSGKRGFKTDWEKAIALDHPTAKSWLEQYSK